MGVEGFYEKMYGNDHNHNKPKSSFLYRKRGRFELNRNNLTFENTADGGTLLEIGCGDSELLFKRKNKYQELWGVILQNHELIELREK